MSHGWVMVHRKLLDNPIFKNDKLFRVFMYLLLKASHTDHELMVGDQIVSLKPGQLATGRKAISDGTGLTEQNVRTAMSKLERLGILTSRSTNKFSVISMINWNDYQQANQQVTSSQPASNQQVTTNNNVDNGKNGKNGSDTEKPSASPVPYQQVVDVYHQSIPTMPKVQVLTDARKRAIKNFWNKRKKENGSFNIENWEAYCRFIASNCGWMAESRPRGDGTFWKPKNLDYILTDKCYVAVKEDRAND